MKRKIAHQSGQEYIDSNCLYREARKPKSADCSKCRYKCQENFNTSQIFVKNGKQRPYSYR